MKDARVLWPIVNIHDWCGRHQPKVPERVRSGPPLGTVASKVRELVKIFPGEFTAAAVLDSDNEWAELRGYERDAKLQHVGKILYNMYTLGELTRTKTEGHRAGRVFYEVVK